MLKEIKKSQEIQETSADNMQRRRFIVGGQVQGVGFRPFVYRLALEHGLTGSVGNTSAGVCVEVQGVPAALAVFEHDLAHRLPPLARISQCTAESLVPVLGEDAFRIVASHNAGGNHSVLISPDVGLCEDCRGDMADSHNLRFRYPFTNCTNCGPRYTITRAIPYDRAVTSMACFPLCPACQAEYDNPLDRRFHAQPNACPVCGPIVWCEENLGEGKGELFIRADDAHSRFARNGLEFSPPPPPPEPCPSSSKTFVFGYPQGVLGSEGKRGLQGEDALKHVAQCLRNGQLAAIKGLGGFHLACDATNAGVVALLRQRKARPHKPFAVMVSDVATARRIAHVGAGEEALLCSAARPIVLCAKRIPDVPGAPNASDPPDALSEGIAPDVHSVGLVLPYTPLHVTLLDLYRELLPKDALAALVMTSGNAGGEPICLGNREALRRLQRIADVFLLHNRDILVRNDDSVVGIIPSSLSLSSTPRNQDSPLPRVLGGWGGGSGEGKETLLQKGPFPSPDNSLLVYRRARGYVPGAVALGGGAGPCVLGAGPELKATLCLTRGDAAFVSQHVGDLQNLGTLQFYEEVAAHLEMILECKPEAVVQDLHPDFMSTAFAQEMAAQRGLPCWSLQHHFAHAWAVLAEHGYAAGEKGAALALVLDGTGMGEDGTIWGGELLWIDTCSLGQQRLGRLRPFALPGGEAAIREPWRVALALEGGVALALDNRVALALDNRVALANIHGADVRTVMAVREMLKRNVNCPLTSSAGRLFDAVSAALGLCGRTTYEGQAAIKLEAVQQGHRGGASRAWDLGAMAADDVAIEMRNGLWELDSYELFAATLKVAQCENVAAAARAFHVKLAQGLANMTAEAARVTGTRVVALSGGVMQNTTLASLLPWMLEQRGLTPLMPRDIPANDGGVSLGQAVWGRRKLMRG